MNNKKVNWLFLVIIVVHFVFVALLSFTSLAEYIGWNIVVNLFTAQMIVWVPAVVFLIVTKTNPLKFCRFRCVKPTTLLMTVLYTMLCGPITTLANAISMLFVDNTVAAMSGEILGMPFGLMLLLMAGYGPFSEEFVFRGIVYQGYKKQGNSWKAMLLAALLFAVMHMNLNQAVYAFIAGLMLILIMEATDSIWPSVLAHFCVNGFSVVTMYSMLLMEENVSELMAAASEAYTQYEVLMVICLYLLLAVICTPLAGCVLVWIAGNEGRQEALTELIDSRKMKKVKLITLPLIIALAGSLVYMILEMLAMKGVFG